MSARLTALEAQYKEMVKQLGADLDPEKRAALNDKLIEISDDISNERISAGVGLFKNRDRDIDAFKNCSSFDEMVTLMTKAVKMEMLSPTSMFLYDPQIDKYGDSNWWGASNRWKLLVRINESGVVTTNANEGEETAYEWDDDKNEIANNYRCQLSFIIQRDEKGKRLIDGLKSDGFVIQQGKVDAERPKKGQERVPMTMFTNVATGEDDVHSSAAVSAHFNIEAREEWIDSFNDEFRQWLLTECDFFWVRDPFFNRPADHPTGLFSRILFHVTGGQSIATAPSVATTLVQPAPSPSLSATRAAPIPSPLAAPSQNQLKQAQAKARKWWKEHPRGMKKDMNTQAKVVVDKAKDYIPSKNDFLGFDDGSHRYTVKWMK